MRVGLDEGELLTAGLVHLVGTIVLPEARMRDASIDADVQSLDADRDPRLTDDSTASL